jgi:hypothetical protein
MLRSRVIISAVALIYLCAELYDVYHFGLSISSGFMFIAVILFIASLYFEHEWIFLTHKQISKEAKVIFHNKTAKYLRAASLLFLIASGIVSFY